MKQLAIIFLLTSVFVMNIRAQEPNYDESKVPSYTLPDLLVTTDGKNVESANMWREVRRPEILELFKEQVYGHIPDQHVEVDYQVSSISKKALRGKAVRKEITGVISREDEFLEFNMLIYLPNNISGPVPAFLALNFDGNHTIHQEPGIEITGRWLMYNDKLGIENSDDGEATRGSASRRWPVEKIIDRGYGLVTIFYFDFDPDIPNNFNDGIHPFFYKEGQEKPKSNEWGAIGAWAWGLSRAMDYIETDQDIDADRVALLGHSRLGKTALWAGALDQRFSIVISNNSGCGGAALSRRAFGESIHAINTAFPHWFCDNFNQYNNNEKALPVDQHMLLALIAPRPLYVASAAEDRWADPKGEFLSVLHAESVYKLLGQKGLNYHEMPSANQPINKGSIAYHLREGGHDVTTYDWIQYLDFADRHFGEK